MDDDRAVASSPPQTSRFRHLNDRRHRPAAQNPVRRGVIRALRIGLPMIAVILTGLVFAWPAIEQAMTPSSTIESPVAMPRTIARNELLNPHFESLDSRNRPYSVTASRALQSSRDTDIILLEDPVADMTVEDQQKMAARATRGSYRQNASLLYLHGDVHLQDGRGYELKTEKLWLNVNQRGARTDTPVQAFGAAGTLEASGMQVHDGADSIIFTGPARLVLTNAVRGLP